MKLKILHIIKLKILLCGAQGTGKTNLFERLCGRPFNANYTPTIGLNFEPFNTSENRYRCVDASGAPRFQDLVDKQRKGADIVCLCFDPRKKESFYNLRTEINLLSELGVQNCQFILVETRSDLEESSQVSEEEIAQFMNEQKIKYRVKTSAITGNGLDQLKDFFDQIYRDKREEKNHEEKHENPLKEAQPVLILNDSESENNNSFLLYALIATAAAGGFGLCVAAVVVAGVGGSIPLAASLLAGGVVFAAVSAGTFFYNRSNQSTEKEQYVEVSQPKVPTG